MEKISPCPAAPCSPSGSRWENHSHLCRHLASFAQEAVVLQDSIKPFPHPQKMWGDGARECSSLACHFFLQRKIVQPLVWSHSLNSLDSEKKKKKQTTKHSFKRNPCFLKKVDVVWKWKHVISILQRDGKCGICEESLWTTQSSRETIIRTWMQFTCKRDPLSWFGKRARKTCLQPKHAFPSLWEHNHWGFSPKLTVTLKVSSEPFHRLLLKVQIDIFKRIIW